MANTKSAQKAVRKIARRTAVNKNRRSQMRTSVRKVEEALEAKDAAAAAEAFRAAEPLLARSGQKGLVHRNAAARMAERAFRRLTARSPSAYKRGESGWASTRPRLYFRRRRAVFRRARPQRRN